MNQHPYRGLQLVELAEAASADPDGVRIELEQRAARGNQRYVAILALIKALG